MDKKKYYVFSGEVPGPEIKAIPQDAEVRIAVLDKSAVPGCMFTLTAWYAAPLEIPGLRKHDSGEVLMFLGSDHEHPESLNAKIELQIENDVLTLAKTCAVFIPAGAAHGNLRVKSLSRPVLFCCCHTDTDTYLEKEAVAAAAPGTFAGNYVDRYDTTGVKLPKVDAAVMTRLFYMDSRRVPGAPYFESVWFNIPTEAFLAAHTHRLDELIFFAGTDPEHPEDLDGHIRFYVEGEPIDLKKSCLLFLPRGVSHNPFEIVEMNHPCLHFSGGNNSDYQQE